MSLKTVEAKTLVPVARILKAHGILGQAKQHQVSNFRYKTEILNPGSPFFYSLKDIWISSIARPQQASEITFIEMMAPPEPLGGAQAHTSSAVLSFTQALSQEKGLWVLVPRESFPPLENGEIYLEDMVGLGVVDESQTHLGFVVGFSEPHHSSRNLWVATQPNLEMEWEVPMSWIDWALSKNQKYLVIPGALEWKTL